MQENGISKDFVYSKIVSTITKADFAGELINISGTVKNIIKRIPKEKEENQPFYLQNYVEYRYMQIVGALQKLTEHFYRNDNLRAVASVNEALRDFTRTNHVKLSYNASNSYHVNNSLVNPTLQPISSSNLMHGFFNQDEVVNFTRCVQPVINEKAKEPPQVTLFQTLFQTDPIRKLTANQFSGQLLSTHGGTPFPTLRSALLDLPQRDREYCQAFIVSMKYAANDYMELFCGDEQLNLMPSDAVYSFD